MNFLLFRVCPEHTPDPERRLRVIEQIIYFYCGKSAHIMKLMQEPRTPLDETDSRLLAALQRNAHLTAQELGEQLNLSASQAGRRRQRLEALGLIRGYGARLDAGKLGLSVQAFVQVQMDAHSPEGAQSFGRLVETTPEVTSAWTLTGEADYLLRIFCTDLSALNRLVHETLLPHPAVARVQSQIVMDQFKADAPLPL